MNLKFYHLLGFLLVTQFSVSQELGNKDFTPTNKGKFYVYWGWNRSDYTNSDITFKGKDYHFTLKDVSAQDNPQEKFGFKKHLNPLQLTVPQTNFRVGYFFKENYSISFGFDHMKYIVDIPQEVIIDGFINDNSTFDGTYNNQALRLEDDFLEYEYTDGLNYVNFELDRHDVLKFIKTNPYKIYFSSIIGIGSGIIFPRTDATLLGKPESDRFYISGYGISAKIGLNITFLRHFFLQTELKGGYINMFNSKPTNRAIDTAKHDFFFNERILVFGARFNLLKQK